MLKKFSALAAAAALGVTALVAPAQAATTLQVTAMDYHFMGIPKEVDAGKVTFEFVNEGEKMHEMVVFRHKTKKSTRKLLELPQEQAEKKVEFIGAAFAKPGKTGKSFSARLGEGRYFALCFVQNSRKGEPHFAKGMVRNFHVVN